MRYGVRNYVERFFKTLKRRLSDFGRFFPHKRGPDYPSYWYWLLAFSWFYNAGRIASRFLNATLPVALIEALKQQDT
jgi:hypothetical protein